MDAMDRRLLLGVGLAGAAGVAALSRVAAAGPLDPPAGPVGPTGLTLEEVAGRAARPGGVAEPRQPVETSFGVVTITQPGSYVLTGSRGGVSIESNDVTLDLCGFLIQGGNDANLRIVGSNVVVRNGRIGEGEFGSTHAVRIGRGDETAVAYTNILLEDLELRTSRYAVFTIGVGASTADRVVVRRVVFRSGVSGGPQTGGLLLGTDSAVLDCVMLGGRFGVDAGARSVVRGGKFSGLGSFFPAINVGAESLVADCLVDRFGASEGIRTGDNSVVRQCVVTGCATGIAVGARCSVVDCSVFRSGAGGGVRAGQRLMMQRCQVHDTQGIGVKVSSFDAMVADCSICLSSGVGLDLVGPCVVDRCKFANNVGALRVDALARVAACHFDFNGPYAVTATSGDAGGVDIRECTITRHATAVSLARGPGSAVTRCTFHGNDVNVSAPTGVVAPVLAALSAATATNPLANLVV